MTTILIVIGLVVIGVGIFFVLRNKNTGENETEVSVPQTREQKDYASYQDGIEKLLVINLTAREKVENKEVLTVLESTIDSIRNITEEMSKSKNFSESSVMFGRIIDKYLPELVYGYTKLSDSEQKEQHSKVIADLERLNTEVSLIEESLSESSVQDFEKTGKLINAMFQKFDQGEV